MSDRKIVLLLCLLALRAASYSDPSTCSQLYNYLTHQCEDCPANTAPAANIGYCNCSGSYYPNPEAIGFNHADSCLNLGVLVC